MVGIHRGPKESKEIEMSAVRVTATVVLALVAVAVLAGCRDAYPHSFTIAPGDIQQMHAKPAEGSYYTN
jgi:hypothetical protein